MRKFVFLAAVAVLASLLTGAGHARTDPSVLAIDRRTPGQERLLFADPVTLRPRGDASVELAGHGWPYAFARDRTMLVLARWGERRPPSLRLVDARGLRVVRDVPLGADPRVEIKSLDWLGRQVVVLIERRPSVLAVVRVDSAQGRIVASTEIGHWAAQVASTPTRLVALLAPIGRIGSAKLLVVTGDRVRTVALPEIGAGSLRATREKPYTAIHPGLTVSPRAHRAWVIGAGRSAEVDLDTLAVRYHGEPRHFSSTRKTPVVGSAREARWLAPGRLVVAGWDAYRAPDGNIVSEPTGLRVVDARGWASRTIHPRALLFYIRPPHLVTIAAGEPDCGGPMLTAYTLAGVESHRVCEPRATGELQFAGPYARLGRVDGRIAVVHLGTGAVVARVRDVPISALDPLQTG